MRQCAYSKSELEKFLEDFYTISGINININNFGETDAVLYGDRDRKNFCKFCTNNSEKFAEQCARMDKKHFESVNLCRKADIYKCHMGMSEAIIPIVGDGEILCIIFLGQIMCNLPSEDDFKNKVERLLRLDPDFFAKTDIGALRKAYFNTTYCSPEQFRSYIRIAELCAQSLYNNRWIRYRSMSIAEAFRQYIADYITERLTIQKTAMVLNVSASHLSRIIKNETGMNFTDYVMNEKVKKACELLRSTDMSVKNIAVYLGINDANYFSRIFKKYMNATCKEYREARDVNTDSS